MTDVNKTNTKLIFTTADARPLYAPAPAEMTGKMGVEVEMALYKIEGQNISIPTPAEMAALQNRLKEKGFDAQLEAAGVLEYASPAVDTDDIDNLAQKVRADVQAFAETAKEMGFIRAPYSILPTTTREEAFEKMASRERLVTSINAMLDIFPPKTVEIPLLTAGVQTSFSPKDADQLLRMVYRAYALTPLLIAAMNTSAGFVKNDAERKDYCYRVDLYEGYSQAGRISPAFLKSSTGAAFIDNHIEAVFDAPLHFAYNLDGSLISASRKNPLTFRGLIEEGLNTQSNYELAESFLYNDVKICNLRDTDGAVVGKRMEVRAADSGMDQPVMAMLLAAALVPDGQAAKQFDAVLQAYGFTGSPVEDAKKLQDARDAAVFHKGQFMDVDFGKGRLREFAADVAGILIGTGVLDMRMQESLRLVDILMTGNCDAKQTAEQLTTLNDVRAALVSRGRAAAKEIPAAKPHSLNKRP